DSPLDLVGPDLVRLAALGGFGRLAPAIGRHLRDDRLRRIFSFQALYAGVPPERALAAYAVIAYMDTVAGVYFPKGGMRAIGEAMADAATKAGAALRFGESVQHLERAGESVTAVITAEGERLPCDHVVLTTELPTSYRLLGHRPRRWPSHRYSPSAVVLHLGTDRTWDHLQHHTISFGAQWEGTFTEIIDHGVTMSDPSLLITQPTLTDPSLAPDGHHLFYVLAPTPNLAAGDIDWDREGPRYRDALVTTLEERGMIGLNRSVRAERLITPADWAREDMVHGTPFSLAHTFAQTGPFRPRNTVPGTTNAFLAGCGTTPGVGLPTVLVSGKLAAARVMARTEGCGRRWLPPARTSAPPGSGRTGCVRIICAVAGCMPTTDVPTTRPPGSCRPNAVPPSTPSTVSHVGWTTSSTNPPRTRPWTRSEPAWTRSTSAWGALWRARSRANRCFGPWHTRSTATSCPPDISPRS